MSSAVPLVYTLKSNPDLSTLVQHINSSTNLSDLFSIANNFTCLAPINQAFATWSATNGNMSTDMLEATLEYHLLNGS